MSDSNRIDLVWRDNRTPGEPEWSADCGCAFHYYDGDEIRPHVHQCALHAAMAEGMGDPSRWPPGVEPVIYDSPFNHFGGPCWHVPGCSIVISTITTGDTEPLEASA